jgi:hypothetical protein
VLGARYDKPVHWLRSMWRIVLSCRRSSRRRRDRDGLGVVALVAPPCASRALRPDFWREILQGNCFSLPAWGIRIGWFGAIPEGLSASAQGDNEEAAFHNLQIKTCPFSNLPPREKGRWGQGLTADKMVECRWLKPLLVAQIEYADYTDVNHLRHSKFIALRDDKPAKDVTRERPVS